MVSNKSLICSLDLQDELNSSRFVHMRPRNSSKRLSIGYSNNSNFIKSSKNILNQVKEKIIQEECKININ
jgi:K+-transporting ATPase c subunit